MGSQWHHQIAQAALRLCVVVLAVSIILAPSMIVQAQDGGGSIFLPAISNGSATVGNAGEIIPGQYVVVLEDASKRAAMSADGAAESPAAFAAAVVAKYGGTVLYVYDSALSGFAAQLPPDAVVYLKTNQAVTLVEPDQVVVAMQATTQNPATWGIDRIDQHDLPLSNSYTYAATGLGVNVYIIDTGIRSTHSEFGGRVGSGFTAIKDRNGTNDCNGHGTHVAGTVGGTTYGVAKDVSLHPVRVLNCRGSGTTSGVIAGIDWVTIKAVKPAVANMSLGGGISSALDAAVNNSINAGVTYVVAAGNSNASACNYSPARVPGAITVGATTSADERASYSNYGSCLDVFAPGSLITSAWNKNDTSTNTISGTSMATPHVTGVAALFLQENPNASPSGVVSAIVGGATTGNVTNVGKGSPNLLLFTNY